LGGKQAYSVEVERHCAELKASLTLKSIDIFSKQEVQRQYHDGSLIHSVFSVKVQRQKMNLEIVS